MEPNEDKNQKQLKIPYNFQRFISKNTKINK